ncbi:MAG: hypothetical protein PHH77_04340 [Victivallaceae bacterium]|nr:hypothetical protein [Victivallaceae bacterium]
METINVSEIKCEFDRKITEKEIQARAESISGVGLIHSIKIQKIEDENFKYQVVAGRKSFAALTQIIGKTELQIPEEVSFIEGDAEVIAFAENDERTDLTLAEQVDKLEKLSERFGIAELASHLSHSPQWIAARVRLKALADCWKQAMRENEFPHFVIGHYEAVARYPEDVQGEVYNHFRNWNTDDKIPLAQFGKFLEDNFTFLLKNAPWNTDNSYQGCGECPACLDRQNNGFLFDDMNDYAKARCQNRQYYQEQLGKFIAGRVEKARQTEPEIVLVAQSRRLPEDFPLDAEEVYPDYAWSLAKKKEGGQKALVVYGPQAGKTVFVKIADCYRQPSGEDSGSSEPEEEPQKRPGTLSERKERKHRQRQRHCITALIEYLEAFEYPVPGRDTIFRLVACLGVDSVFKGYWGNGGPAEGIRSYPEINAETLDAEVWKKLANNLVRDLKPGQSGQVEARWTEAEILATIVGFDLEQAFAKAVEVLPDPKSWKELEKQEQVKDYARQQAESAA